RRTTSQRRSPVRMEWQYGDEVFCPGSTRCSRRLRRYHPPMTARRKLRGGALAAVFVLLAAGCGDHGSKGRAADVPRPQTTGHGALPAQATRTVAIRMGDDLRFDPDRI